MLLNSKFVFQSFIWLPWEEPMQLTPFLRACSMWHHVPCHPFPLVPKGWWSSRLSPWHLSLHSPLSPTEALSQPCLHYHSYINHFKIIPSPHIWTPNALFSHFLPCSICTWHAETSQVQLIQAWVHTLLPQRDPKCSPFDLWYPLFFQWHTLALFSRTELGVILSIVLFLISYAAWSVTSEASSDLFTSFLSLPQL